MHDAHIGRAFLFLEILAECTLLSMTVTVTLCLWYVVGMRLAMSHVKFPQAPFASAPFGKCRKQFDADNETSRTGASLGIGVPCICIAAGCSPCPPHRF